MSKISFYPQILIRCFTIWKVLRILNFKLSTSDNPLPLQYSGTKIQIMKGSQLPGPSTEIELLPEIQYYYFSKRPGQLGYLCYHLSRIAETVHSATHSIPDSTLTNVVYTYGSKRLGCEEVRRLFWAKTDFKT